MQGHLLECGEGPGAVGAAMGPSGILSCMFGTPSVRTFPPLLATLHCPGRGLQSLRTAGVTIAQKIAGASLVRGPRREE